MPIDTTIKPLPAAIIACEAAVPQVATIHDLEEYDPGADPENEEPLPEEDDDVDPDPDELHAGLLALVEKHGLTVVKDAAHELGRGDLPAPRGIERVDEFNSTIELLWPIEYHGKRISRIRVHHPTGEEFGRAIDKAKTDAQISYRLISVVSSLPFSAVNMLMTGDIARIVKEIDFLQTA